MTRRALGAVVFVLMVASLLPDVVAQVTTNAALHTSDTASKQPRVDVRHLDFAAGCPNAADPTGHQDSTCAIHAAVVFASAAEQRPGGAAPALYFPHGTYKISGDPRIPCGLHVFGDGSNASIIEETNNDEGVTVVNVAYQPDAWDCNGSMSDIGFYTPNGHKYIATQLQLENTTGYRLYNVRVAGGGGRGIALLGNSERIKAWGLEIDTVRWPLIWWANESHIWGLNIVNPGQSGDNYCFGPNNCVNGVFPNAYYTGGTLVSAGSDGTTATFYIHGTGSWGAGYSPVKEGHRFQVTGTTGAGLDGMYVTTHAANGIISDPSGTCKPASPCFEVQAASKVRGTATVSGATWQPVILPERVSAVTTGGADFQIEGGSIKTLWYTGGITVHQALGGRIAGIYFEGFPMNGQPHLNADITEGGMPFQSTLTEPLAAGNNVAASVASTQWFEAFVNDPAGTSAGEALVICPADYVRGSKTASANPPGVQQGQCESTGGYFSTDGKAHIGTRGTQVPAGTVWPPGSIVTESLDPSGTDYGSLEIVSNHLNSIDGPANHWYADCQDNSQLVCAEIIAGTIPNGMTTLTTRQSQWPGARAFIQFIGGDWWTGSSEAVGQGYIKARGPGASIEVLSNGSVTGAYGSDAIKGLLVGEGTPDFINVQESDGSYPISSFIKLDDHTYFSSSAGPAFTKIVSNYNDKVTGSNPGTRYSLGRQFSDSWCDYDLPPSGQTHSLNRFCIKGGPNSSGSNAGWEHDIWNGSAWAQASYCHPDDKNPSSDDCVVSGSSTAASFIEGRNYVPAAATSTSTGSCTPNGYIPMLINGVQVHVATCN